MIDTLLDISANLHVLAALCRAELLKTCNFLAKANATCAVDAAGHVRRHERADVLISNDALAFVIS